MIATYYCYCIIPQKSSAVYNFRVDYAHFNPSQHCDIIFSIMNIIHALILGLVEGITEFLPISSTGHMVIVAELLKIAKTDFLGSFEISIQLGAILSVVVLFFRRFSLKKQFILPILIAFLPSVVFGLVFYGLIKSFLLNNSAVVLWSMLIGGIALIVFELTHKEKNGAVEDVENITAKQALGIGIFQCLSMVPGVSRAAATIVGGLIVGLKRRLIVEFSFFLAIPTMLAATTLDITKSSFSFTTAEWIMLAAGFITAFLVAMAAIKFLLNFIKNHTFIPFGIYRILASILFWFIIFK